MQSIITKILNSPFNLLECSLGQLLQKGKKIFLSFFLFLFFILQANAADRYWVGGDGNWSNAAAHWSATSGGAAGASLPTAADNVFFDDASSGANYTVTLDVAAVANNFSFQGTNANTLTIIGGGGTSLAVNGNTTIANNKIISFGNSLVASNSSYTFTGSYTAGTGTTTNFNTNAVVSLSTATIGQGSTFRFPSLGTTTVSGIFSPNGTCFSPVTLNAAPTATAPVNFAVAQNWGGVAVSFINSIGASVTVNSNSLIATGNFIDKTTSTGTGRDLYWVGGTGNWSDPARWSLATDGTGGGECIPTITDNVFFNANSFTALGQIVTLDQDGLCEDMTWTGVTNTPTFAGTFQLTVAGSMTLSANMNQTGLAPTYTGLVSFSSAAAPTIRMNGKGLNRVSFETSATGVWTLQDAFLVQNQTLLNSGTLNTDGNPLTTGTLTVNNTTTGISLTRELDLRNSAVTITQAGTAADPALDLRGNDANFTLSSLAASTVTLSAAGAIVDTGTEAKTIPTLNFTGEGARVIQTNSAANTITFRNITTSNNGTFNVNGTSAKVYNNITIGNNVGGTITGAATNLGNSINGDIAIGNNGGAINFNGGYNIVGNFVSGNAKTVNFTGAGNTNFGGTTTTGNGSTFTASGIKNTTFVGAFTLGTTSTATLSNTPAASTNSFSTINMNSGSRFNFSSVALNTVSGNIVPIGSCASAIILNSSNPPNQARLDLANQLDLFGATVSNINAIGAGINVSNGFRTNNSANVTGNTVSRNLYWVHSGVGASTSSWNDAANWSAASGGTTGECPPTIYDNVFFDANSFSAANQIVDMNVDAFCRNMNWTGVTNNPFLQSIGEDTDLTIGGNLIFVPNMTVGTGGNNPNEIRDIYFAATNALTTPVVTPATTNNTIDWGIGNGAGDEVNNGKRFRAAFFNQNKEMPVGVTATWTLLSAFNLTQQPPNGRLTLQRGRLVTANNPMQIRILDANGANGSLDIGNSRITLRATGLALDFQNDNNFIFTTGTTALIDMSSGGGNVDVYTGSVAKEMPDLLFSTDNNTGLNIDVDIFTGNGNNLITFRNIEIPSLNLGVDLNIDGNSPKRYLRPLTFNNGINARFEGNNGTDATNIFEGAVTFGTQTQARFIGDNRFAGAFTVGSTESTTVGITFTGTGRNQFLGDVTVGANSFFSLQNNSANPNTFTNVTLANADVFEFSTGTNTTISGTFTAIADCFAFIFIQSSTAGNDALVNFALAQTWENVIVTDINNSGTVATVDSGTTGGNNTGVDFSTIATRTLYWVHDGNPLAATGAGTTAGSTANWNDQNNWSLSSGGQTGECVPTLTDDVVFDANSFGAANQVVNVDVNASMRDITWTNTVTGNPTITGTNAFNMQIGGDVTLANTATMNWDFNGDVNFRYSDELEADAKNVILSNGQVFNAAVNFDDNDAPINGVWELGDAFATDGDFRLTAGIFTTGATTAANNAVTAATIDVNQVGDLARTLRLNSSDFTVTQNAGLVADFRGNTGNFILESETASNILLTGTGDIAMNTGTFSKTIPNLVISTAGTLDVETGNAANRITFRNITGLANGTDFNVNGNSPKTYGTISFLNNVTANFNGVQSTPLTNLVTVPLKVDTNQFTGIVNFGTNSRIIWNSDNTFEQPVNIQSTRNNGRAVDFRRNNIFEASAPLTFAAGDIANVGFGAGNTTTFFGADVRFEGGRNQLRFDGNNNTLLTFNGELFINSTDALQADIIFEARAIFNDQVEIGASAEGDNFGIAGGVRFDRGVDFSGAPNGTLFITGADSRFDFGAGNTAIFKDLQIAENNELTFNNTVELNNMSLSIFDVIRFPQSGAAPNNGTTTINGLITSKQGCTGVANIQSNLPGVQAQVDFETAHSRANGNTEFVFTVFTDIWNKPDIKPTGAPANGDNTLRLVESTPDIVTDGGNNTAIFFFNDQPIRTFYWVRSRAEVTAGQNSTGNWNDSGLESHWSLSDGGTAQDCIPTANDNVIFNDNSFDFAGNEVVTIDKFFNFARNITWDVSIHRASLVGDDANTLQIFGNTFFDDDVAGNENWNSFEGLTEFKGGSTLALANTSKTIAMNGGRFNGPVSFNAPYDVWTIQDDMRVERGGPANVTFNYGQVMAGANTITVEGSWIVNVPAAGTTLPQSHFVAETSTVVIGSINRGNNSTIDINDFATTAATCFECSSITDPSNINTKSACSGSPFYNLIFRKRWDVNTLLNHTISIYNNFSIESGIFNDQGNQIRGNDRATSNMTMAENTRLTLGNNNNATVFPTCYLTANINLADGTLDGFANNDYDPENPTSFAPGTSKASIVVYRSPDEQLVRGLTYGTLALSDDGGAGNRIKRFTGNATIRGDFFIVDDNDVYDMGYQITGNDLAQGNRMRIDGSGVLRLGTNNNTTENTYTSPEIPLGVSVPNIGTQAATDFPLGVVTAGRVTTFPSFINNTDPLNDIGAGGKIELSDGSAIVYNASADQQIAKGFTYGRIILRATGATIPIIKTISPAVTVVPVVPTDEIRVTNQLIIEEFNHMVDAGNQIRAIAGGNPMMEARANSKLILGNQTIATKFPTIFVQGDISLFATNPVATNHETIYNSDVAQLMSTEPRYANLTLTAPNLATDVMVEKRFSNAAPDAPSNLSTAIIRGDLLINQRNHLLDDGNQITGLAVPGLTQTFTMRGNIATQARSWLTLGVNVGADTRTRVSSIIQ